MLLFLTTNMAAVTSRAELGHRDVTSNSSVKFRFSSGKIVLMLLTEKIRTKTIKKLKEDGYQCILPLKLALFPENNISTFMKQGFLVMDRCKRDEIMTACASPVTDIKRMQNS